MAQPLKTVTDDKQRAPVADAPAGEGNIYQRLNAVMREVRGVEKESTNKHGGYKYAGHQAVNDAIRDSFARHGIVQIASVTGHQVLDAGVVIIDVRVSWISTDSAGTRVDMDCVGIQPAQTKEKTVTAQQVGQAISYAVKCAQFKGLMLRGDNEEDADEGDPNGPREDNGGSYGRGNDNSHDDTHGPRDLAVEYLARFADCKSAAEVMKLSAEVKANWAELRSIRDFADHLVKARSQALAKCKVPARQPGED